jgi:hypothetical protein
MSFEESPSKRMFAVTTYFLESSFQSVKDVKKVYLTCISLYFLLNLTIRLLENSFIVLGILKIQKQNSLQNKFHTIHLSCVVLWKMRKKILNINAQSKLEVVSLGILQKQFSLGKLFLK